MPLPYHNHSSEPALATSSPSRPFLQTLNPLDKCKSKDETQSKDDVSRIRSQELTTFVTDIHESISVTPHLYHSYTWVLYTAVSSGSQYIRAKLRSARGPARSLAVLVRTILVAEALKRRDQRKASVFETSQVGRSESGLQILCRRNRTNSNT